MKKSRFSVVFAVVCFATLFSGIAYAQTGIADLVAKMPPDNTAQERQVMSELVKLGTAAIKEVSAMLVAPGKGDDSKARYALHGLAVYVCRPEAAADRKMYEQAMIEALKTTDEKEIKAFIISQLQLAGTDASVEALSKYLGDERLCEPAARALVASGASSAKESLRKALKSAKGPSKVTIIKSLGTLRYGRAAKDILKFSADTDTDTRMTALWAVANIADKSAEKIIEKALAKSSGLERAKVASFYLLYAQRLTEKNKQRQAAKICRKLIKSRTYDVGENIQCAALSTLVSAEGKRALNDLLNAMGNESIKVQAAALALADSIEGKLVTKKWVKKARQVPPQVRARIISMLAARGDGYAMDAITKYLQDGDKQVRLAAIKAAVTLGGDKGVDAVLSQLAKTKDADEIKTVKQTLLYLKGTYVTSAVAKALPKMSPGPQVTLIEILADRRAVASVDTVFSLTASKDRSVSIAATKALGKLAGPDDLSRLIDLMLNARGPRQQSQASKVVVRLCLQNDDVQARAKPLLAAMKDASTDQKISIIKLLPAIGGSQAFEVVLAETKNAEIKIQDTAIRSLTKWKGSEAMDALLEIAGTTKETNYHVIALKGYVNLVAESNAPPETKVDDFEKAMSIARRPDEKKLILSRLARIRSVEALEVAVRLLDDKTLAEEAALAIAKITFPSKKEPMPLAGPGVGGLLLDAYPAIADAELRKKIDEYVKNMPEPLVNNQAPKAPEGFVTLFNGKDLTGWKGLLAGPYDNPAKRAKLSGENYAKRQAEADDLMRKHWHVVDGVLYFDGGGFSLATIRDYGDFEMLVDWKLMSDRGDSGIYLRGSPQVQIWDPVQHKLGSGGLYNNRKNPSKPSIIADNPIGQWNTFRIKMIGEKVTIHLNGKLVVDNVTLENYWDRSQPIFPTEQIELQCHGDPICFRNIFIREIPRLDEFVNLFNGHDLTGWVGDTKGYIVEDGKIVCKPGGNLYTEKEYSDFTLRFEFKLTPGANNGLGIRTSRDGDAAYQGMELQILDNSADKYKDLKPYQYHGSIYGVVPAKRGFQKPVGQWNSQKVIAKGNHITVILNGETIVDADLDEASKDGTMDGRQHPGLKRPTGHIGFLGHGSVVEFRNIRIKPQ